MAFSKKISTSTLAGIQYHGEAGFTQPCIDAIVRLLQAGDVIEKVWLLSGTVDEHGANSHAFLLRVDGFYIAVKSGFGSGYGGEGHKGLSKVLKLFLFYELDIDELHVGDEVLESVDKGCLTKEQLAKLESTPRVLPVKFYDYIIGSSIEYYQQFNKYLFPYILPLAIIDTRIMDLAKTLRDEPDARLFTGYRRLEDAVREKSGLKNEVSTKLFSKAFTGDESILIWQSAEKSENKGLAQLFVGTYMAYRNKRAHKEQDDSNEIVIREFLLLNELFLLEAKSVLRDQNI